MRVSIEHVETGHLAVVTIEGDKGEQVEISFGSFTGSDGGAELEVKIPETVEVKIPETVRFVRGLIP